MQSETYSNNLLLEQSTYKLVEDEQHNIIMIEHPNLSQKKLYLLCKLDGIYSKVIRKRLEF
jgi:hypothetical protein